MPDGAGLLMTCRCPASEPCKRRGPTRGVKGGDVLAILGLGRDLCLAVILLSAAASAACAEEQKFENAYYSAVISTNAGGMLQELVGKATGESLVTSLRLYTDYGVYDERGYVGTGPTTATTFVAERGDDSLMTVAEGKLAGAPAEGKPALAYRVENRLDASSVVHVAVTITPEMSKQDVNGFLAICWVVPCMVRWQLRTIEGLLRHTLKPGEVEKGRSYGGEWPLDPVNPLISAITRQGAELRVENIKWSGVPAFTTPIIHGEAVFLCWLVGEPRDLVAGQSATVEFDLRVVPPGA